MATASVPTGGAHDLRIRIGRVCSVNSIETTSMIASVAQRQSTRLLTVERGFESRQTPNRGTGMTVRSILVRVAKASMRRFAEELIGGPVGLTCPGIARPSEGARGDRQRISSLAVAKTPPGQSSQVQRRQFLLLVRSKSWRSC